MDNNIIACSKCQMTFPANFAYCPYCGKKQGKARRSTRRANGFGSIYWDGSSWRAAKTVRTYVSDDGNLIQQRIKRRGFPTKKAAAEWLASITANHIACAPITLEGVFFALGGRVQWQGGAIYHGRIQSRLGPFKRHQKQAG